MTDRLLGALLWLAAIGTIIGIAGAIIGIVLGVRLAVIGALVAFAVSSYRGTP